MSPSLSQSVQSVRVQRQGCATFKCAVAETQGRRDTHEDAHAIRCKDGIADMWVFDGHRGDAAAHFGANSMLKEVNSPTKEGILLSDKDIRKAFQKVDCNLRSHLQENVSASGGKNPGSTVVGALLMQQKDGSYSAKLCNCGDSRGVLFHGPTETEESTSKDKLKVKLPPELETFGQTADWAAGASWLPSWPAIVETIDHKPNHFTERSRIEAAGGKICGKKARIDGNLAVSRGLGDFDFKSDAQRKATEQKVTCYPDIYEVSGMKEGTLLLLACDGLWDVLTCEEVVSIVRARLRRNPQADLGSIAAAILRLCLLLGSMDNLTVMLTQFTEGSEWTDVADEFLDATKDGGDLHR